MQQSFKKLLIIFLSVLGISGIVCTLLVLKVFIVPNWVFSQIVRFHVSWSVLSCILLGIVIEKHIVKMLKYKNSHKKILGIGFLMLFFLLIFSSFAIRHIKIQPIKSTMITLHWIFGVIAILVFLLHLFYKKPHKISNFSS